MKDYDRSTEYFRKDGVAIENFEPWREILAKNLNNDLFKNKSSSSEAVKMLAQVDPSFATRLDNSVRRANIAFNHAGLANIATTDPKRYIQLVNNQDDLVNLAMHDFEKAARKLASRVSIVQWFRVVSYFRSIEKGTPEFLDTMEKQSEMLKKAVPPLTRQ